MAYLPPKVQWATMRNLLNHSCPYKGKLMFLLYDFTSKFEEFSGGRVQIVISGVRPKHDIEWSRQQRGLDAKI